MKFKVLILSFFFASVIPCAGHAQEPQGASADSAAPAQEARTESQVILDELTLSMELARDGQFGRIKGRDMERLESAYAFMVETLETVESPDELNSQKRQSLALAQSQLDEILKPEDQDRKICKRVPNTGTRLGALECLTVAERRERARASRRMVNEAQSGFCVPGEGTPCTRGG